MHYVLLFSLFLLLTLFLTVIRIGVKEWLDERNKYQYRGAIYLGYIVTPEGKHVYKFEDKSKTQVGFYGGAHHRHSLVEYGVYNVMVENNKYLKGVKKIV